MNALSNLKSLPTDEQEIDLHRWTASSIISSHNGKGFTRGTSEMKVLDMTTYFVEVFPPEELAKRMQQPPPDILTHLAYEGIDIHHLNRKRVSFLAKVSLPYDSEDPEGSAVDITLNSEQAQNRGVYKQEIKIPRHMLRVSKCPIETVLNSLNHALHEHNWYPSYY